MQTPGFAWTDGAVTLLKDLWGKGLSASQCCCELADAGHGWPTRNAVVGKVHRLGLGRFKRGARGMIIEQEKPISRAVKKVTVNRAAAESRPRETSERFSIGTAPMPIPPADVVENPVDYCDLEKWHCRAPVDGLGRDGLMRSCGRRKMTTEDGEESSYCPEHHRRFKNPWALRKERNGEIGKGHR